MNKKFILSKIKKYLFFISIVFLVLTSSHLVYIYIYNDSKEVAQKGGTISEGIIGKFPHLNPLKKSNNYNDYINHILYRSLLTYDYRNGKIVGDITNCDISNLSKIECFLNENILWSNGDKITFEDIVATYDTLRENNINPVLKSLLQDIKIEQKESSIVFLNEKKDINTLNIFFQPILPAKLLANLTPEDLGGSFSPIDGVYSGLYVVTKVSQDDTLGITKLFLEKNMLYPSNPAYIDKIIFKIFKDSSQFLKHKDSVSIFNDTNNLIGSSIPKLEAYKYYLPQYIGLFINTQKVPYPNLRNLVLQSIDNEALIGKLGKQHFKAIDSPFLDELKLETNKQTKTIVEMLESLGYYSKTKLLSGVPQKTNNTYSDEVKIEKQNSASGSLETNSGITKQNYLKKSEIIFSPDWVDNYNYISKDDILLKGNAPTNTDAVYVNDYKLKGFSPGDKNFFYRLRKSYNTLKEGKNEYNIYFESAGKKSLAEKIVFFYSTDKEKLKEYEDEEIQKLNNELEAKEKEENKIKDKKISQTDIEENKKLIEKLNNLEDGFYYDKDLKPYSMSLYYILDSVDNEKTANYVKEKLEEIGIKINKKSLSINELRKMLKEEKKDYDILITGINSGYFSFNLFPYLHSSQVKSGFNFSKFKKLSLDQILEELKSHNLNKEKIAELEKKILKILKENSIFKTLYTPLYSNLVDKNIEGYSFVNELIPSSIYRFDPLVSSYVSRKRIINSEEKGFIDYLKFLINSLF